VFEVRWLNPARMPELHREAHTFSLHSTPPSSPFTTWGAPPLPTAVGVSAATPPLTPETFPNVCKNKVDVEVI
jgi:hypothetical protein